MENKKVKIAFISGLSLTLVILLTFVSRVLQNSTEYWVIHTTDVKFQALKVFNLMQRAESTQRGYLLTGNKDYLTPIEIFADSIESQIIWLKGNVMDNRNQLDNLDKLEELCDAKLEEISTTINLFEKGQEEDALSLVYTDVGKRLMDSIEQLSFKLLSTEDELLNNRKAKNQTARLATFVLLLLAALTAAYSLFTLYRQVSPLVTGLNTANKELKETLVAKNQEILLRENAEAESKRLIDLLVAKNEELKHFAFIASHDLQEPLRTVNSFIEALKEDYNEKLDSGANQYLSYMQEATARMKALIEGLLAYSRIGRSGQYKIENLQNTLADVTQNLDMAIRESQASIVIGELPTLACLPVEIRQLFQNLVLNAIKFSQKGQVPRVEISAREMPAAWEFCVKDNGIGIEPMHQEKIFKIFSRLHLPEEYQGEGLGLAFCKKIVELHEGRIWVESEPGKGSEFFFTISKNLHNANGADTATNQH